MTGMAAVRSPPVLLVGGGGVPETLLQSASRRLGLRVAGRPDDLEASASPCLLVSAAIGEEFEAGLKPPFNGIYEWRPGMSVVPGEIMIAALGEGGLAVSVSTARAYHLEVAAVFSAALGWRLGLGRDLTERVEMALQEAVANALVHGNLEVSSEPRGDASGLAAYCRTISERLVHPVLSRRHAVVAARPVPGGVEVQVADQGQGYDMETELSRALHADAKAGRGLKIITHLARRVEAHDGGRRISMVFTG